LFSKKSLAIVSVAALTVAGTASAVVAGGSGGRDNSRQIIKQIDPKKPKNVILIIGDGTGDSELTIAATTSTAPRARRWPTRRSPSRASCTGSADVAHLAARVPGPADARLLCPEETKAAGGLGSITEQLVDGGYDVNLGGGSARFEQELDDGSGNVIDYAQDEASATSRTPRSSPRSTASRTSRCSACSPRST
jgi:alkaline phosphatase